VDVHQRPLPTAAVRGPTTEGTILHHHTRRLLLGTACLCFAACTGGGTAREAAGGGAAAGAATDSNTSQAGGATAATTGAGATSAAQPAASAPVVHRLASGTTIALAADTVFTSRHNHAGDSITATVTADVRDASGAVVIPRGAVFLGTITRIAPAEHPGGQGTFVVGFAAVRYRGRTRPVATRVADMATVMAGRGVTSGEVVKTGAGAAAGAVAGRVIGGNATGAVVGAAAGAAAGAGYAALTRDIDIVLPQGAAIHVVLTEPLAS